MRALATRPPVPEWLWADGRPLLRTDFQPIVDLQSGELVGHELLTRGTGSIRGATELFTRAREEGVLWELEHACWTVAAEAISALEPDQRQATFFLNVVPEVLGNPAQRTELCEILTAHGISPGQIVIEITEHGASDIDRLAASARELSARGFRIALDDFGAGFSGLVTLIHCAPSIVKLDRSLVREVHQHAYRQELIRSLVAFASGVDATVIAEGIEYAEELRQLMHLGVRWAQGFLVGTPQPAPVSATSAFEAFRQDALRSLPHVADGDEETVGTMAIRRMALEGSVTSEDLERLFRKNGDVDHVVIVREERPTHLITRQHFHARLAGPPAETTSKPDPLIVRASVPITTLARLAMERRSEDLYDPVLVTDDAGRFLGSVTIRQLISRATELELREAQGLNPLTQLPGNRAIERWIRCASRKPAFTVIYADLDHFKAYNDRYGFLEGDRLLRVAARVLQDGLHRMGTEARLGHIGGDDFVIVAEASVGPEALAPICARFDEAKRTLFSAEDLARGGFEAVDRRGVSTHVPLVTMSLAVIDSARLAAEPHPALLSSLAASLKKRAKSLSVELGRSTFFSERRRTARAEITPIAAGARS